MTIYAVHPVKDDLTAALRHGGPITFCTDRYVYADEIVDEQLPTHVRHSLARATDRFEPFKDYLLIVGDHLQLLVLGAMLTTRHGAYRVLRYDRQAEGYVAVWI